MMFSVTVNRRDQHEMLMHHAEPGVDRIARAVEVHRLSVDDESRPASGG